MLWSNSGEPVESGWFSQGERSGRWSRWHKSGELAEQGAYRAGRRIGRWNYWASDGSLLREIDHDGNALDRVDDDDEAPVDADPPAPLEAEEYRL